MCETWEVSHATTGPAGECTHCCPASPAGREHARYPASMRRSSPFPLLFALGCTPPMPDLGCGGPDDLCQVASGQYLALLPDAWDRTSDLPTFVHFHGHGGSAVGLYDKESFTEPMGQVGALAIYPDGLEQSWNLSGHDKHSRDDLAFFDEVLDDVVERLPVDPDRLIVSGFSVGGSMAWDVACYRGAQTGAVFAPVSGAFWRPLPQDCPAGPVRLRHEHGVSDTVFPLEGRQIREGLHQGDVRESIDTAVQEGGCTGEPQQVQEDGRQCQVWRDCADGAEVQLCLHDSPGDHRVTSGWHRRAIEFAEGAR